MDASATVATHISHILSSHSHELLGLEETQKLLDKLAEVSPRLVEELVPKQITLSTLMRVLQNLLRDSIPINDLRTICESLLEYSAKTQEPSQLTELVRAKLGRRIVQDIYGNTQELSVMTLHPELEGILQNMLKVADQGASSGALEPGLAERMHKSLRESTEKLLKSGTPTVLLVPPKLRQMLSQFARTSVPELKVLGLNEMPENKNLRVVATIGG